MRRDKVERVDLGESPHPIAISHATGKRSLRSRPKASRWSIRNASGIDRHYEIVELARRPQGAVGVHHHRMRRHWRADVDQVLERTRGEIDDRDVAASVLVSDEGAAAMDRGIKLAAIR